MLPPPAAVCPPPHPSPPLLASPLQTAGCNSDAPACHESFQFCQLGGACATLDGAFAPVDLAVSSTGAADPRSPVVVLRWSAHNSWAPYLARGGFRVALNYRNATGATTEVLDVRTLASTPTGFSFTNETLPLKTVYTLDTGKAVLADGMAGGAWNYALEVQSAVGTAASYTLSPAAKQAVRL